MRRSTLEGSVQPNIILINCDDLGYGDLGCYGSPVNKSPALDKMADEGIRFTDFYMASSVCSPSRASMLTGCYPPRIGFGEFSGRKVLFPGDSIGLSASEITIADLLKTQGYATGMVGKWHCGDQPEFLPTRRGFDSYFGIPYSNDMGINEVDDENPPLPVVDQETVVQLQPDQANITEEYLERAIDFINENKETPFFLYFAHMYVHLPIYVQERFLNESSNGSYGAAVASVDWVTEEILKELENLGLDEKTLVVFTSDNGSRVRDEGGSNGPLRGIKGTTWEGGMRVPCIMRWPGKINSKQTRSQLLTSMDLFATLATLGGAEIPSDRVVDGNDFSDILLEGPGNRVVRDDFFYYNMNNLEAVRSGKWKLHVGKVKAIGTGMNTRFESDIWDSPELYNLESDIGETDNVYELEPDVAGLLKDKLDQCRRDIGDESFSVVGENVRPADEVEHAKVLNHVDLNHPLVIAMYDMGDT